jgi:lipopolysaccharide export system ATP-binding protein
MPLTVESLFVSPGGTPVLKGVYVRVDPGLVTVLFGENGAGKTTLLRAIAGQIRPASGITVIDELRLHERSRRQRFRRIAYLPEDSMIPGDLRVSACAAEFGLSGSSLADDRILSDSAHQRVSRLSMGERRYLELLCVLALKRDYVILDEPFSRLAPLIGQEMLRRIREAAEAGTGVLVTDHYYRLLMESADRAYFLRGTRCREVDCSDLETQLEELGYLPAISVDRSR